jgi:hypothetical protein
MVGLLSIEGWQKFNFFDLVLVADCRTSLQVPGEPGFDKRNLP